MSSRKGQVTPVKISVQSLKPNGIIPQKSHPDDPGYDITLVGRKDDRHEDTNYGVNEFTTSIAVSPPAGHYLVVVAHGSLQMQGYNIIGGSFIIHPSHTGELIIPLYKFREVPDIQLPCACLQLIPVPIVTSFVEKVAFIGTVQKEPEGGFGSFTQTYSPQPSFSSSQPANRGYYAPEGMATPPPQSSSRGGKSSSRGTSHLY